MGLMQIYGQIGNHHTVPTAEQRWIWETMKKCSKECTPCCDYCKYVVHEVIELGDKKIVGGPIFCKLHLDKKHIQLARACGSCKDFWCMNADKFKGGGGNANSEID